MVSRHPFFLNFDLKLCVLILYSRGYTISLKFTLVRSRLIHILYFSDANSPKLNVTTFNWLKLTSASVQLQLLDKHRIKQNEKPVLIRYYTEKISVHRPT